MTKNTNLRTDKQNSTEAASALDAKYISLRHVLELAYEQSARGKGSERHANGKAFDEQPIMEIARMVGPGGHAYQIMKKAQEAVTMHDKGHYHAAQQELLGAIVYCAAMWNLIEPKRAAEADKSNLHTLLTNFTPFADVGKQSADRLAKATEKALAKASPADDASDALAHAMTATGRQARMYKHHTGMISPLPEYTPITVVPRDHEYGYNARVKTAEVWNGKLTYGVTVAAASGAIEHRIVPAEWVIPR